ncbi:hypothetical protein B0H15DRAFT_914946 [Mycena belliarum]|uniref:Uncharacterized protein n=1 Tax=Mycena belliarum TaxID=1033014 RepID=A0AAD6XL43_9AGAR|nr:hypothetical protein B0H15DRAFT_914946 [Mycena belliae]
MTELRATIFIDILNALLSRAHSSTDSRKSIDAIRHALMTCSLVISSCGEAISRENETAPVIFRLGGGLTEIDIRRFCPLFTLKLDSPTQNLILDELESALASTSDFINCLDQSDSGDPTSRDPLHDIQKQLDRIAVMEVAVDHAYDRVERLSREIDALHPRLQQRLAFAVKKFPQDIAARNSANNDLLAMTIEASLVKVSLIRAQAQNSVYDYRRPKAPDLHMKSALSAAFAKLKEDERKMEDEEGRLDRDLAEYQTLLDMVDGGRSSGFRQIVTDCAAVDRETEECRRDLRRLGWTGDDY